MYQGKVERFLLGLASKLGLHPVNITHAVVPCTASSSLLLVSNKQTATSKSVVLETREKKICSRLVALG
jgi:hypothetical protein